MSKPKPTQIDQNEALPKDTLDSVSPTEQQPPDATLYGGDVDAAQDQTDAGEETVGGSSSTPDQNVVEELGRAMGISYEDSEPLRFGEKLADRDADRWELDPASSEDYQERLRGLSGHDKSSATLTSPAKQPTPASPTGKNAAQSGQPAGARTGKQKKTKR